MTKFKVVLILLLPLYLVTGVFNFLHAQVTSTDYTKAERLLSWNTRHLVVNDNIDPNWIDDNSFWYRNHTSAGHQFKFVDIRDRNIALAFDHTKLVAQLNNAISDTSYIASQLPFENIRFENEEVISFKTDGQKYWEYNIQTNSLKEGAGLSSPSPGAVRSPDGKWEAYVSDYNLFIRNINTGEEIRLTEDGEKFYSYGLSYPSPSTIIDKKVRHPSLKWSPDSKYIVIQRVDERGVGHMHYISHIHQRPKHYSQPYPLPGDSIVPKPNIHLIDIAERSNKQIALTPEPNQLSIGPESYYGEAAGQAWGSASQFVYVDWLTRGSKSVYLAKIEASTGNVTKLATDSSRTYVEMGQREPKSWYVTNDGQDVFWWSERDGWAHIYRYSQEGVLKNQVTEGSWAVGSIKFIDEENERIYFSGRGRESGDNPYYAHLYSINYDGSDFRLLTPEFANHKVDFSPNGQFFVDTYSTISSPPKSVLRSSENGQIIMELEQADAQALKDIGWKQPVIFSVKARDGITDLYGLIYFPPNYDPEKKYPVIDHIYPGPQFGGVGNWEFKGGGHKYADEQLTYIGGEPFALAQLGFIVFELDHMGTPHRSKAFHDTWYGNFIDNGLPDHVKALKQLAARYQGIDLERVGIYGHSGGGFATTDALLRYPDTFHVGVAGAGNHDNRSYNIYWAEKYQGILEENEQTGKDNFYNSANKNYAKNLKGELLLFHGDMDDNVHPAMTIQLVDELIKANKDFDLIIAPERRHSLHEPYFIRQHWDFFVEHLLNNKPPDEFEITIPSDY